MSESARPRIGIEMRVRSGVRHSAATPSPSEPTTIATFGARSRRPGSATAAAGSATYAVKPAAARSRRASPTLVVGQHRQRQHRAAAGLEDLRVGQPAGGVGQHQAVGAGRVGGADQRAEVAGVLDAVGHQHQPRVGAQHLGRSSRRAAARPRAARVRTVRGGGGRGSSRRSRTSPGRALRATGPQRRVTHGLDAETARCSCCQRPATATRRSPRGSRLRRARE